MGKEPAPAHSTLYVHLTVYSSGEWRNSRTDLRQMRKRLAPTDGLMIVLSAVLV